MDEELNYVQTGGEFGRKRRIPGFVISKNSGGLFVVSRESDNKFYSSHYTLEGAEKSYQHLQDGWVKGQSRIKWT